MFARADGCRAWNRAKQLLEEPYTQKTAEAAAGLGVWTDTKLPRTKKAKAGEDVDMS